MKMNYIIKTISVPNQDKEKNPNEERITLEVICMEKIKTVVTSNGISMESENFVFIGFEKNPNKPKTLYAIHAETVEDIIILAYEKNKKHDKNKKSRSFNRANH